MSAEPVTDTGQCRRDEEVVATLRPCLCPTVDTEPRTGVGVGRKPFPSTPNLPSPEVQTLPQAPFEGPRPHSRVTALLGPVGARGGRQLPSLCSRRVRGPGVRGLRGKGQGRWVIGERKLPAGGEPRSAGPEGPGAGAERAGPDVASEQGCAPCTALTRGVPPGPSRQRCDVLQTLRACPSRRGLWFRSHGPFPRSFLSAFPRWIPASCALSALSLVPPRRMHAGRAAGASCRHGRARLPTRPGQPVRAHTAEGRPECCHAGVSPSPGCRWASECPLRGPLLTSHQAPRSPRVALGPPLQGSGVWSSRTLGCSALGTRGAPSRTGDQGTTHSWPAGTGFGGLGGGHAAPGPPAGMGGTASVPPLHR